MRIEYIGKVLVLASLLTAGGAMAQDEPLPNPSNMSAEEREDAREARREAFENMTDEERVAAREERGASGRGRRGNMTDEERQAMREARQAEGGMRSGSRGSRGGFGGRGE